jgi:predicted SAM-dependent methyltransferase
MLKSKYLYVGCGSHRMEGFIHADISVYKLSKITDPAKRNIDIICDITENIPLPDDSMEIIFSRDTLEHLTWYELINHLIECNRILKEGSIIRMTLPNMDKIIERYQKKDENLEKAIKSSEISTLLSPIENHTDLFVSRILYHDHFYLHNYNTMKRALEKCGFGHIKEVRPGETSEDNFKQIFYDSESGNENISFHIEAKKIRLPSFNKTKLNLPKNFIKKTFAYLFNISISPYNKRRPMFPNKKWFLEKFLKIKQNYKK